MLAFAQSAAAATLGFTRSCYRSGQQTGLIGAGFTPAGRVALGYDGRYLGDTMANPAGVFGVTLRAATQSSGSRRYTFGAVDRTNPAINALALVRITALDVTLRPRSGSPGRVRRIGARGFVGGRNLYAHVRRGRRYKRDLRVGRLRGPCAKASARKRLLRRGSATGTYRVQFDVHRRYRRTRPTRVVFRVTVFRTFRSSRGSASAASVGERWTRIETGASAASAGQGWGKPKPR